MPDEAMFRPPMNRSMRTLDRTFFKKTIPTSAARILDNKDISLCRKVLEKSKEALIQNRIAPVRPDPVEEKALRGGKCIILRPEIKHDDLQTWSSKLRELHGNGTVGVIPYELHLDYSHWTYSDIVQAILPGEEGDEVPTGFSLVGHVAHLNLRDRYLPYKHLIADILRDKNPTVQTVINKLDRVGEENEYRTFQYEVLVGPDNLNVEVHEQGCAFRFDFAKVYWNSRLHTEHERLVSMFNEGDAICDVMAGVGPFAVPAGKKRVFAWANDLNPESYASLTDAIKRNKVADFVRSFNSNGHDFIRTATSSLLQTTYSVPIYPKTKTSRSSSSIASPNPPTPLKTVVQPRIFSHYVMNLPASALTFLPSFVGLYANVPSSPNDTRKLFTPHTSVSLPMIHAYCFSTKSDNNVAEAYEICVEISRLLGHEITPSTPETQIWDVRDVAPKKRMFCASFRLPAEVAFRTISEGAGGL